MTNWLTALSLNDLNIFFPDTVVIRGILPEIAGYRPSCDGGFGVEHNEVCNARPLSFSDNHYFLLNNGPVSNPGPLCKFGSGGDFTTDYDPQPQPCPKWWIKIKNIYAGCKVFFFKRIKNDNKNNVTDNRSTG